MVTAIVPAYNAGKTIRKLLKRTSKFVDRMIVVDDGSKDDTFRKALGVKRVRVVRLPRNMGKSYALRVGLSQRKDNMVVFIDADLQHLPEEIPKLLACLRRNKADICIGSRFFDAHEPMPLHRRWSNRMVTFLTRVFTGYKVTDAQSGFRVFGKKALRKLTWKGDNYDIEVETLLEASRKGLKVCEVPMTTVYSGQVSYLDGFKHTWGLVKMVFRVLISGE